MSAAAPDTPPSEWRLPKLRIDVDGDWFDDDVQITHPGILANLRGNLRKDGDGHFIQTRVRIPVQVADAPFVVTRVERRGDLLHIWLNDGSEEDIAASAVHIGAADVPYSPAKHGAFEARLSRAAAYQFLTAPA